MALNLAMVWELRQAGSASNGGGFRNCVFQAPPSAPAVSGSSSGGTVAANTYYVVVTYTFTSASNETPISGETAVTTTGTTSSITVTHPTDPGNGATWNCYVATTSGGPYFPQGTALAIGSNRSITATPPTSGTQPAGTDRTLSTSATVAVDNSAITATTAGANSNVLTFTAGYTPTGADVGNVFKAVSGTNINAGWYEITAITATTWTVTGAQNLTTGGGAGSAIVGNMGGAVNHPATIAAVATNANILFVKYSATAYTFSNAGNNVSGGTVTFNQTGLYYVGYDTTRTLTNADANRPIHRPANNSLTLFNCNTQQIFRNIDFDNPTPNTSTVGLQLGSAGVAHNCRFNTYQTWALQITSGSEAVECEFISCGASNIAVYMNGSSTCVRCLARACTSTGQGVFFTPNAGSVLIDCVAYGSTGSNPAFNCVAGVYYQGCVAYGGGSGNTAHGFTTSGDAQYDRCVAYGNTGWGFTGTQNREIRATRCFTGNNTVGAFNTATYAPDQQINCVALSGDPFTNASAFDFSTNTTAGAGAAVRGLTVSGPPGSLSYPDAGAVQHADPVPTTPVGRVLAVQNIGTY